MILDDIETTLVGGAAVARLDLMQTARLMLDLAQAPARPEGPYYFTSVNGEVLARRVFDKEFARLIDNADSIAADGQPLVSASHLFSRNPLPERVATTDLYPVVALLAQQTGASFYLLGGSEEANRAAFEATRRAAPDLKILGRSHGFLEGRRLAEKVDEINALAPDMLWLAMGVPLEQHFVRDYAPRLKN
ncbi:WecB/TagA/CpsF family glycosyltransferase [Methylocystis echinoides]|uniref:WecB/TagA/CpsF family glycosyltransferase n=1 Tax=Methylocystis echinoides TaxID=29468 RepID=UPI003415398B